MSASVEPVVTQPFVLYQSALLNTYAERLIHGFSGKPITLGGPGNDPDVIRENRLALCRQLGLETARLTLPRQTHTDRFRTNDLPCQEECDAIILTEPGITGMVQVADCVPVILYEPKRHVGAVIHAGWRGTAEAITQKVAQALHQEHQAQLSELIAVIGPSIGGCCYEVSDEVAQAVAKTIPHQPVHQFQVMQSNGKPRIDLKQVNRLQLEALGVAQIDMLDACTYCQPQALWSYRRGENGRQVGFLQLL